MTYEDFKMTVYQHLKDALPAGTSVCLQKICKNNGLVLDGLTISSSKSNVSPTILLDYYYEKRHYFPSFEAICQDILLTYEHNKSEEPVNIDFFYDYKQVRKRLAYRLVNYEKNKELLQTVPYIRYLDLAVVFFCLLDISGKNSATILIHSGHLDTWEATADDLYELTCLTTPLLLPYELTPMSAILSDTLTAYSSPPDTACPMYVLTNTSRLYGAGCILYPGLLSNISAYLQSDLFLLPSSIHEVILLPVSSCCQPDKLASLVSQVNQTELAADEILSSHVYCYSRAGQALRICGGQT